MVEYWENFSVHAFENTTQNFFMGTTILLGKFGNEDNRQEREREMRCSCCFTIRRDVRSPLPSLACIIYDKRRRLTKTSFSIYLVWSLGSSCLLAIRLPPRLFWFMTRSLCVLWGVIEVT